MLNIQMKPAGQEECDSVNSLFIIEEPVWFGRDGKVSPIWLSACKQDRHRTKDLMDSICDPLNLIEACKRVVRNGGSSGPDGMQVSELGQWLGENLDQLRASLLSSSYLPGSVRSVTIPKPNGGHRQLGIPNVKDRLVQQSISQALNMIYDATFSGSSYGFRPKRSAHQALKQALMLHKSGKRTIIDIDLEKFFDEVNHHRLMWMLSTRIGDLRVLGLINRFLNSGILKGGLNEQRTKGTPQGSPLSPILSNIILDELDQELGRRGLSFVRYADDVQIFVSSTESGVRVMGSISSFIENRMKLKVNLGKSSIRKGFELNFLGHTIVGDGIGVSKRSLTKFKDKLKRITQRNRGISLAQILHELQPVLKGWLEYFKYAKMKSKMVNVEAWLRRRLKCLRLKQCKRCIGIVRFLRKLRVGEQLCWKTALSGKGWWRLSNSPAIAFGMTNKWFEQQGYYALSENYKKLHRKLL